ncbi:MAG: glycine--tRNA ligase [Candidatus Paceibacterota bacterium]
MQNNVSMEQLISLCKRRGFIFPGSEIYGGLANAWDFGPLGVALKNNIKRSWWQTFVEERDDMYGLDAALLMNRKVWQASGHESTFSDPLVECKNCHTRVREDQLPTDKKCSSCGKDDWSSPKQFNLMLKTFLGPAEEESNMVYFRPETAQAMFIDFKQIVDTYAPKMPFGIAQIGKAFRNEITPGNFIFRTREFEQMEIEYFIKDIERWNDYFEMWLKEMNQWIESVGIDKEKVHNLEVSQEELAHYSKRTVDVEFDFPFGRKELFGLAYRGDFDLQSHQKGSGQKLEYFDEETKERVVPHVIEPSMGVERMMLALLASVYREDNMEGEKRIWLDLPMHMAPYRAAVFPLLSNKSELIEKAQEVRKILQGSWPGFFPVVFDKSGNIGKRYRRQDEIGTPYCFTVDFQTMEDNTITVRDRNTMKQERLLITEARAFLEEKMRR